VKIGVDEPILLKPELRPVLHDFEELLQVNVLANTLAEIVREKLRALLQSRARLGSQPGLP
jgi:hypothetical protein